ncbi:MAG: HPr family phosphocarrier protein [Eubacteriales bacterium]|jgi:phosphocarrier protein HPr|nr:HPr family phosphocarrier protein [Eubacteriales bacterium]
MQEAKLTLESSDATQMKAIAMLIQTASSFRSSIHVQVGEKRANAKSLLGLMSLSLTSGDQISFIVDGPDEEQAVKALLRWAEDPLQEN